MFPSALALSTPIPFVFDFTLAFGPVLLLVVLALLDVGTVALLHAALVEHYTHIAADETVGKASGTPLRRRQASAPPSQAA